MQNIFENTFDFDASGNLKASKEELAYAIFDEILEEDDNDDVQYPESA